MALTTIANVVVPSIFTPYIQIESTERSLLWLSGIVQTQALLGQMLAGGGKTFNMPFWNDLADTEGNISSDTGTATPLNIAAGTDISIRHNRNQAWGNNDLAGQLAGADPALAIANRVAAYWRRQMMRTLVSSLRGLFADNIANDAGDMAKSVYSDVVGGSITDAMRPTAVNIIDAFQTLGDQEALLSAICMHSVTYTFLRKNNLISYVTAGASTGAPAIPTNIPNQMTQGWQIPTYMGKIVLVDDGLPVVAGTNSPAYHTYLFGTGAFAFGEGSPKVPTEVDRVPLGGNGGGQDILVSRREFILHPNGIKFTSSSMAGQSPTNTELQAAANWDRVYPRKLIPLAVLIHNV